MEQSCQTVTRLDFRLSAYDWVLCMISVVFCYSLSLRLLEIY